MAINEKKYVSEEVLDYVIEKLSKIMQNTDFEIEDGSITPIKLADSIGIIQNGDNIPTDTDRYAIWLDYTK